MPIFRCSECGNTIEAAAPPEKCECGAKFSFDEVLDYSKDEDEVEENDSTVFDEEDEAEDEEDVF